MSVCGLFPTSHTLFIGDHRPLTQAPRPRPPVFYSSPSPSLSASGATSPNPYHPRPTEINNSKARLSVLVSKRMVSLSILAVILSAPLTSFSKSISEDLELERYTDLKEGFTLLKPSSWIKVDKAGATVLFEEASKGVNNVGVVVSPVRIMKLSDFGSPRFVADKLIQAERRKESTKDAEVIAVSERSGPGGLQVYEFEYEVDSTRGGMKRVFSAAFVASKKLYLLNIAHSDKPESPLNTEKRMILEEVLHSFDVVPLT
ncbi:unnamed protein product [Ilex paraguariensis]|uniref:PsbP C-terminal domain-containing protein n=1 Tax=Ilex paraguariensis TaxID=185542 RepID=A0ABC8THJ9_9AQUA